MAVVCDSLLLKNSIELFLSDYIAPYEQADIVLSDRRLSADKPLCLIGAGEDADIQKPFSRSQLVIGLEKFYKANRAGLSKHVEPEPATYVEQRQLREKITRLTHQYVEDLLTVIEDHYGRK